VGIDYNVPPNRVKEALGRAAQRAKNVLPNPPVRVFLVDFSDYAMTY
jgi:small-conductance mechanosensitive channel